MEYMESKMQDQIEGSIRSREDSGSEQCFVRLSSSAMKEILSYVKDRSIRCGWRNDERAHRLVIRIEEEMKQNAGALATADNNTNQNTP